MTDSIVFWKAMNLVLSMIMTYIYEKITSRISFFYIIINKIIFHIFRADISNRSNPFYIVFDQISVIQGICGIRTN
jgi:hypothetical protein